VSHRTVFTGILFHNALMFFIVPVLLLLVWRAASFRKGTSASARAAVSVAVTGAVGMASQVAIMSAFQAAFGTLYSDIALLTCMFMFGLTIGAVAGRQYLVSGRRGDLVIADTLFIMYLLMTGPLLKVGANHIGVFFTWSMLAGTITGAAFPAFLGLAAQGSNRDERTVAATIETADHLGAAFGAFVTGVVWLPAFGIAVTGLLLAALKAVSMITCVGRNIPARKLVGRFRLRRR
jgi:predicted membrane-bound spermidine synthase